MPWLVSTPRCGAWWGEERVLFINPFQNPAQLQPWLEAVQLPQEWA
ncbi:hypothetical protein LRS06_15640 [Hymenobacter sp. J193]|nr:hypothetical protein [Hymenobacter sp. J193]MCR5889170.1 hypothetical protein [Hymenobacter sp. J193]